MKPRRLAIYGLTAGLLGGGVAGLALTGTTLASAQVADVTGTVTDPATTSSTVADSSTTPDPAATTADPAAPAASSGAAAAPKNDWAKSVLDGLVAKGSITQAQADQILAALQAARPEHGPGGHGPGGKGGPHGFGKDVDVAAQALGMTADELRTALQGGQSVADVAKAKGVDVSKVVDALVAQLKAHLDEEVKSGEHTQAEADQMLADAKTHIEDFVNGKAPAGGPGFGGPGGGRGHGHGPGGPGAPGAPAVGSGGSGSSGTTTTS
jgi:hypothetical protein